MGNDSRTTRLRMTIVLVTLAICAFFLAQGASPLIASAVLSSQSEGETARPTRLRRSRAGANQKDFYKIHQRNPESIIQRNIFDSEHGLEAAVIETTGTEGEEGSLEDDGEIDPDAITRCDSSLRLLGAVSVPRAPQQSVAALATTKKSIEVFREGSEVEGKKIVSIFSDAVYLKSRGRTCELVMFYDEDTAKSAPRMATKEKKVPPPSAKKGKEGAISGDDMDRGIQRISESEYNIERSLVDKLLENQGEMIKLARILPFKENGRVIGVKLYGMRRNSFLTRLGLENGDMLRTINGFDMTSPDGALEAYAKLRNAAKLSIAFVRRGKPTTYSYNVR